MKKKPAGQGSMGPVFTQKPMTSGVPSKGEPRKTETKRGIRTPGIGGSKRSF